MWSKKDNYFDFSQLFLDLRIGFQKGERNRKPERQWQCVCVFEKGCVCLRERERESVAWGTHGETMCLLMDTNPKNLNKEEKLKLTILNWLHHPGTLSTKYWNSETKNDCLLEWQVNEMTSWCCLLKWWVDKTGWWNNWLIKRLIDEMTGW